LFVFFVLCCLFKYQKRAVAANQIKKGLSPVITDIFQVPRPQGPTDFDIRPHLPPSCFAHCARNRQLDPKWEGEDPAPDPPPDPPPGPQGTRKMYWLQIL
jgi:hypothetical protein